jgi:rRNA processing protein Krr1/Pno1
MKVHYPVADAKVGRVIGKAGAMINQIREATGCGVRLDSAGADGCDRGETNLDGESTTRIELFGTYTQVQEAQAMIRLALSPRRVEGQ